MASNPTPQFTHFALFCRDVVKMEDFFTRVMGLTVTDRGRASSAPVNMIFMSCDPEEHHQFVLVSGRPKDLEFSVAQQMSFLVEDLDELRTMHDRVKGEGMEELRGATHGNAWSIYFNDPEDNLIEIYTHTPWHVPQPNLLAIDFASMSNDQIVSETEAYCRQDPGFMPRDDRVAEMSNLMDR